MNVGERVGDYEIVEVLGAGGMGQVYKVRNTLSERMEAMKVLLPNLESDPGLADRFLREIKVQAALDHPNIAKLHTAMRAGNQLLMFMELVDGVPVSKQLESGPMAPAEAAGVAAQVLDALAYAHAQGVVHRDIKPANIMLTASGGVKLMDFGIARMQADKRLTQTGGAVGSLFYMSPEQIRGAEPDPRSDVYSLGITLYEIVTGRRPFLGDSDYQIMSAHLQQIPQPPTELEPGVPRDLSEIILTAIAKDPAARFQSAAAFRAALATVLPDAAAGPAARAAVPPPVPVPRVAAIPPNPPSAIPAPPMPAPPIPAPIPPPVAAAPPPMPRPVAPPPMPAPPPPVHAAAQKSNRGLYMALGSIATLAVLVAAVIEGPKLLHGGSSAASDASTPAASAPAPPTASGDSASPASPAPSSPVAPAPAPSPAPSNAQPNWTPVGGSPAVAVSPAPAKSPVPPVNASPAPQPAPQQQAPAPQPVQQTAQPAPPPPPSTPAAPAPVNREYAQLREQFNELSIRANTASAGLRSFEQQQSRQGLGLRADIREAKTRLDYQLQEAMTQLQSGDYDAARQSMRYAQSAVETIEKFLGR